MINADSNNRPPRAGKNFRANPDRFFHVMTEGWFIYTREGLQGPFVDRNRAQSFLSNMLFELKSNEDPSASWRL